MKTQTANGKKIPEIWAIGGGKGGVGKSTVSIFLAFWLARMGKRTILVDIDLGGANLHTFMGIKNPPRTLNDFVTKKYNSLEDICIDTEIKNLHLITGASEILSLGNLQFAQKLKIIQNIFSLDADYIVLDLGAGTSFNVLDFFLSATKKIIVATPQPVSILNAYGFIRNAIFRKLSRISNQDLSLKTLIKTTMDTKNNLNIQTIKELFQIIEELHGEEVSSSLKKEISDINPYIITNMVSDERGKDSGSVIKTVAENYLMIDASNLGSIAYDRQLYKMVTNMTSLTRLDQSSEALACSYGITMKLL